MGWNEKGCPTSMEPVSCHNSNLKKKVSKACKSGFENSTPCKKGFATLKKEIIT